MSPYIYESIAAERIKALHRDAVDQRRVRELKPIGRPARQKTVREPLTHAIWHGCEPGTHQWPVR